MDFQLKVIDQRMAEFLPAYGSAGAAAVDLRACLPEGTESIVVEPGQATLIGTGVAIFLDMPSVAGLILPRSGLGSKNGIILGNGTGLIDSDYQGELKISIWNRSGEAFTINHNDRIAQYVIVPVIRGNFRIVPEFDGVTARADGGFGHTGTA